MPIIQRNISNAGVGLAWSPILYEPPIITAAGQKNKNNPIGERKQIFIALGESEQGTNKIKNNIEATISHTNNDILNGLLLKNSFCFIFIK